MSGGLVTLIITDSREDLLSAAVGSGNKECSFCPVIRDGENRQMENERIKNVFDISLPHVFFFGLVIDRCIPILI